MPDPHANIHAAISAYYTAKLQEHGPTPAGVDWNSQESQDVRLRELLRVCAEDADFSLIDYGCGYGRLYEVLREAGVTCTYMGFDVSEAMVAGARARCAEEAGCTFTVGIPDDVCGDYTVASGIFNVRGPFDDAAWEPYVFDTLDRIARISRRGFAFNCLTSHADPDHMRADLYYADPARMLDHCLRRYSRRASLLHDYGLYEFTVLVRCT